MKRALGFLAPLLVAATAAVTAWAVSTAGRAVCVIRPTAGHAVHGTVEFTQVMSKVRIVADLDGLEPNSVHAIHIHEFGDVSCNDGKCAGGHYNPEGHPHGLPPAPKRHAGDLGNLRADASGHAHYEIIVSNVTIDGERNPVLGRAVVVHAKADDGGQPTGNAGGRIGFGVIGLARMPSAKPAP